MSIFITSISVRRMEISNRWTLSTETLVSCNGEEKRPTSNSCKGAPRATAGPCDMWDTCLDEN